MYVIILVLYLVWQPLTKGSRDDKADGGPVVQRRGHFKVMVLGDGHGNDERNDGKCESLCVPLSKF